MATDPVRRFEIVPDEAPDAPSPGPDRATDLILMMLKTFSGKTVQALESCFSLITVALVFWAAYPILTASPTVNQLVGLGIFSIFILISNYLVLRRRG